MKVGSRNNLLRKLTGRKTSSVSCALALSNTSAQRELSTDYHASSDEYETPSGSEYSFFDETDSRKYYSDDDDYWNSDKESDEEKDDSGEEKFVSNDKKFDSSHEKDSSRDEKVESSDDTDFRKDTRVDLSKNKDVSSDEKYENDDDRDNGLPKELKDYISKERKTPLPKPIPDGHTHSDDGPHDDIHRDDSHRDDSHRDDVHRDYGHSDRKHSRHILLSRVLMPSGRLCAITVPAQVSAGWKCGDRTKLITLRPSGQMGKREYTIVKKEMEKSRSSQRSRRYSGYQIIKIQKVVNPCLWKKYKERRSDIIQEAEGANERMLFHGSQAVRQLLQNGFDERHANLSGMFGAGLYFSQNSSKSNLFVFGSKGCPIHHDINCFICERKMFLCRVALGKVALLNGAQKIAHAPVGYQSVEGRPIPEMPRYNEFVIYRGEQAYPEYLITYKIVK